MDFLKNIFGNKTSSQENFVVDESGNAKETSISASITVSNNISTSIPVSKPTPISNSENITMQDLSNENVSEKKPEVVENKSEGEYVGDTSAFDELMKQAESSVEARVLEQAVLSPEFQKAKDELESEGGIEIFPVE